MTWNKRAILRRLKANRQTPGYAAGGHVGPRRKDDSISIRIHAGEHRISQEEARRIGIQTLRWINQGGKS